MTRVPLDTSPQRRLLDELRVEIDRSRARGRSTDRLRALVDANPTSVWSTHVLYNLGRTKFAWLYREFGGRTPRARDLLPRRCDADSSARSRAKIARWVETLDAEKV